MHQNIHRGVAITALLLLISSACFSADLVPATNPSMVGALWQPHSQFKKGQTLRYSIKVEQDTRLPGPPGNGDFVLTSCATFDTLWTVQKVTGDGDAEIEISIERFSFTAEAPTIGKIVAGTDKTPEQEPAVGIQKILSSTQKGVIKVNLTPTGKVTAFSWSTLAAKAFNSAEAAELIGFFGDLFSSSGAQAYLCSPVASLPSGPLRRDVEWKADALICGLNGQDVFQAKPAKSGAADSILTCDFTTKVIDQTDGPPVLGGGTLQFDLAQNRLVAMERHYDLPLQPGTHSTATITVKLMEKPQVKQHD
jgi:hypothetical protein